MKINELTLENTEIGEMALPSDWDEEQLGHDKSFAKRVQYAKLRAKQIGTGSSRVAFIIPDNDRDTILKVAKNKKGMAQNAAEVDILTDSFIAKMDIVIPLIDYDKKNPNPTWIQTEKAEKIKSNKQLAKLLGCRDPYDLVMAVRSQLGQQYNFESSYSDIIESLKKDNKTREEIQRFKKYVDQVSDLVANTTIDPIDFGWSVNWGLYQGRLVIIDLGFTEEVKSLHYNRRL